MSLKYSACHAFSVVGQYRKQIRAETPITHMAMPAILWKLFYSAKTWKNIEKTLRKDSQNGAQWRCSEALKVWQRYVLETFGENEKIVKKSSNLLSKASHVVFSEPFWGALGPLGRFWDTFWSLWATLVTKSLPKVPRRLPKGSRKWPKRCIFSTKKWIWVYYTDSQKV